MDCPLCLAKFCRVQHLERHLLTHDNAQQYACTFCGLAFNRRDALKRHWRTCKSRLRRGIGIPFSPSRPRGRKKRACDRCTRLKRACDSFLPCSTCLTKQLECSYNGVQEQVMHDPPISEASIQAPSGGGEVHLPDLNDPPFSELAQSTPSLAISSVTPPDISPLSYPYEFRAPWWPIELSISSLDASWSEICPDDPGPLVKFDFLARFTSADGFANSFRCGTLFQRQKIASIETSDWDTSQKKSSNVFNDTDTFDTSTIEIDPQISFNVDELLQNPREWPYTSIIDVSGLQCVPEITQMDSWAHHPLALKTQEIIEKLKQTIRCKPRKSSIALEWSKLVENMGLLFFSPPNVCKFLRLFWSSWYPNCPIIHRPTFDPFNTSPSLLSSMVIIGSCLSPEKRDNQLARTWFNAVEEMVFDDEWLEEDSTTSIRTRNPVTDCKRLQSLQAAYFVCLYQNWEGSDSSKQRIRRHRYNTLIAIARDLHPASASHLEISLANDSQTFQWKSFIEMEEKIRTLSYIFLLDGGFVIFNNMPPRIVVAELEMSINCPDECFQASTASECFAALATWAENIPHYHQYSIASVLETMFQQDLSPQKKELFAHLGIINLFMLATALHTLMFQLQNALAPPEAFQRIENALQNWKDIWVHRKVILCYSDDIVDADSLPEMWKRVGFMKDACEFWLLCRVILERIRPSEQEDFKNTVPGRVLEKYDETNMKQVNDLMQQFETVSI